MYNGAPEQSFKTYSNKVTWRGTITGLGAEIGRDFWIPKCGGRDSSWHLALRLQPLTTVRFAPLVRCLHVWNKHILVVLYCHLTTNIGHQNELEYKWTSSHHEGQDVCQDAWHQECKGCTPRKHVKHWHEGQHDLQFFEIAEVILVPRRVVAVNKTRTNS